MVSHRCQNVELAAHMHLTHFSTYCTSVLYCFACLRAQAVNGMKHFTVSPEVQRQAASLPIVQVWEESRERLEALQSQSWPESRELAAWGLNYLTVFLCIVPDHCGRIQSVVTIWSYTISVLAAFSNPCNAKRNTDIYCTSHHLVINCRHET